jgi:hypothetical protein
MNITTGLADIGPDLLIALARKIPTLETDALVRLMTSGVAPPSRTAYPLGRPSGQGIRPGVARVRSTRPETRLAA